MPLPKPVLIRLLNNGTGNMVSWPRQFSRNRLITRVCKPFHHPRPARLYSTAQELLPQSFVPRSSNDYNNQGLQRQPRSSMTYSREGPSDLSGYTDVEKAYGRLRIEASHGSKEGGLNASFLAHHLVRVLGQKPDMRIYSALILANCRPEGSVAEVKQLVRELRAEGFDLDSSTCHDVLKVLSVHPDYLLQTDILNYMQSKWFNLTENGWHDVLASTLRDHQFEMVTEKLDRMRNQGMQIQSWLYDLTMYKLAEIGELDDVFRLLKQRIGDSESNISAQLWYYMLDVGSRALHYDLARYVWKRRVQTRYLNPSSGICVQMLNIAARHGDAQLAHDIISFLEERPGNTFDHSHYELLIAAYVNSSNLENALAILSVMQSVNVLPNGSTTRPVYQYLTESKDLPREAFAILRDLHSSGQPISVASVNCLIDAAIYFENLNLALDFYKSIHELCVSAKPNIETFNALLRGCRVCGDRKDIALILAAEMVALKIQPNALTYDRMLLICIRQKDDYEDGMKYFQEMQTHKMRARYGTLLAVVRRLTVEADARVDAVLEEMENVVDISMVMRLRKWVNMYWGNKSVDINRGNATFSINEGLEASSDESNNVTPDASHACSPNNMDNLPPTEENAAPSSPEKESDVPSQKEVFDSLSKERENFLDDTIISSGGMVNSPTAEEADISSKAEVDGPARIERGAYLSKDMDNVFDELGVNDKAELISEQRRRKELKK